MKPKYSEVGKPELLNRSFRIETSLWREFKDLAENKNSTLSKTLRKLIEDYIENNRL